MPSKDYLKVAIVGCGAGGITVAMRLKSQLGITNLTMYERNDGVGGVWKENTYPGCACDVQSPFYSSVYFPYPYWTRPRAPQDEIRHYWQRIHEQSGLWKCTRYNSNLIRADWVSELNCWRLTFQDVLTKDEFVEDADIFIPAVGTFASPRSPSIPGLEQFKGPAFHSARWDHSVYLSGKRVGLVGNACSAAQILPVISEDPTTTVINLVRRPQWFLLTPNEPYTETQKLLYANVPGLMKLNRWRLLWTADLLLLPVFRGKYPAQRRTMENETINYIRAMTPSKYHDFLIPKFPIGTRRMIVGSAYLDALSLPNVELIWDPVERITESSIELKNGESRTLDVLVFATGFDTQELLSSIEVRGSSGQLLSEVWESKGGAEAYLGSCVAGFPNMFMIYGPNTSTGHTSVIFFLECQVRWQLNVLKRLLRTRALSFDVTPEAEEAYNAWLQDQLKDSVWATGSANSWYHSASGKIHTLWPGTAILFWWMTLYPKWKDLTFAGARTSHMDSHTISGLTATVMVSAGIVWYGCRRYLL